MPQKIIFVARGCHKATTLIISVGRDVAMTVSGFPPLLEILQLSLNFDKISGVTLSQVT